MRVFLSLRTAALAVALTSVTFAVPSFADDSEKSGDKQADTAQSSADNNANDNTQRQNDASANNNDSNNNSRDSRSNSARKEADKNQSNQDRDDRSGAPDRKSSQYRDRDDRDSNRSENRDRDRDDRNYDRDRSNRDSDRNADNRRPNTDRNSSRDSRHGSMRGPDIGIWFSRSGSGLVISDVSNRGPIAKLGFREGDRIVSVNGQRVAREEDFMRYLVRSDARRVTVIVIRDNREETIYVEPALLVDDQDYVEVDPLERFGIILDDRYDDRIVVWRVIPRSPAYYAGFRPGDVIITFSGRPYRTRTEFETGSRTWQAGDANVQIRRGDRNRDLSVEIPNVDRQDRRNERSQLRNERTAQRDTSNTEQRTTNQNDQNNNREQRDNRGGILNRVRPGANR